MEIVLCFTSYEDKKGMYYNAKIDLECFDKDCIIKEVEAYYKKINVEEFLLADTWTDDNDSINDILLKNYTENFYSFIEFLEELQENYNEMENINGDLFNYINDNYFSEKGRVYEILNFINDNIIRYENIDDIFLEKWENDGNNIDSKFISLFYWLSSDIRIEFLNQNVGTFEEFDGAYYEFLGV